MSKISIILTSYNHAKYLRESIDSVLNQTFSDFELIIGDDASTDESWEIIQSYTDPRIHAIRYDKPTVGRIINDMLLPGKISSEFIAIHHSDDVWEPQKLEQQIAILENRPEIGAVFTNALPITEDGSPLADTTHFYYKAFDQPNRSRHEWLNYFFYHGNALCHPSILIRKKCYETCGPYRYGLTQISDFEMWVRLCLQYEIHVLPEKLVRFRVRDNHANMSSNTQENHIRGLFEYLLLFNDYRHISNYADLVKIFPIAEKYYLEKEFDVLFSLGMVVLETLAEEPFQPAALFGLQLLFEVLNDPNRAKLVKQHYDFDVNSFRKLSGSYDVFSFEIKKKYYEQLSEFDLKLLERDTRLKEVDTQLLAINTKLDESEWTKNVLKDYLTEKDAALQSMSSELLGITNWANALKEQLDTISVYSNTREKILDDLNNRLLEIYGSRSWKMIQTLWKVQSILFPPNSFQVRMIDSLKKVIRRRERSLEPKKSELQTVSKDISLVNASVWFDRDWYLNKYHDVKQAGIDPAEHYFGHGGFEGRDPGPNFSSAWYFDRYPDVFAARMNPLVHFVKYGQWEGRLPNANAKVTNAPDFLCARAFGITPHYLNPDEELDSYHIQLEASVAVQLHLNDIDSLEKVASHLNNIPCQFDLYISVIEGDDLNEVIHFFKSQVNFVKKIIGRHVPMDEHALTSLVLDFGKELACYDYIGCFNTPKEFGDVMEILLGTKSKVTQILDLLAHDAKIIYAEPNHAPSEDDYSWGNSQYLAEKLLLEWLGEKINEFPLVEFPQTAMFWAKSSALQRFLNLPLSRAVSMHESSASNDVVMQVVQRMLLISANRIAGRNYRICLPSQITKSSYFERQRDFRPSIMRKSIKILSYYLPQFYTTPENDEWHGKGFTEWTKVRSTNPLFYGHAHQRVPHEDIGYYSLTSMDMLKKQVELMKCSGVYGQIFYHYWFTGRLILEKPAQMLLEDKSVEMPFCFCWANENWTKKWDGNESEILLGQTYSEEDAVEFIQYLIPFFKDDRYIKINERPVLYVYRPSSIPDFSIYKNIWDRVCKEHGIQPPYVVAVLTRGAISPLEFGMDAGCERVLHDWTGGNVRESKSHLYPYQAINGTVLDYEEVANYYMGQSKNADFTYFRSIIPSWDNTPRYGSEAYVIHNSSPEKFQEWLEALVEDAENRLNDEERFIVINAWNEWAETAFLEPDKRFGYAYLNSIGRVLAKEKFADRGYLKQQIPTSLNLSLSFGKELIYILQQNNEVRDRFFKSITEATIFSVCNVTLSSSSEQFATKLPDVFKNNPSNRLADYTLQINKLCYFTPETIENMVRMALAFDVGTVIPSHLNDPQFTHQNLGSRWNINNKDDYMFLFKSGGDDPSTTCCVDAKVFISDAHSTQSLDSPKVSTILRFSRHGNMDLLRNALYSLAAQVDCSVQPILAVQDLTDNMLSILQVMLKKIPWARGCDPIIREYHSTEKNPDLRSLMLNDALKGVTTAYASFLDFDDVVFHDSYRWMTDRLRQNNKNACFGLIFTTDFNLRENKIKQRKIVYDYGTDFKNFLRVNHSPIHGIMLNLSKIDLDQIEYFEDMKYMEDYYLTMQIFTDDGTDWDSLRERKFVGDYFHYEDKDQTLGIREEKERIQLISSSEYIKCEERIRAMRNRIIAIGDKRQNLAY